MKDENVKEGEGSDSTSTSLLERACAQDREAWQRLNNLYAPLVRHWCLRAGLQAADADDRVQEVFEAVFRHLPSFQHDQPGNTFRGWIRTITRNKLRDFFNRRQGDAVGAGGSDALRHLQSIPGELPEAEDEATVAEEKRLVYERALALLRTDFETNTWQAFWRVTIEGEAVEAVGDDLKMTPGAIYVAKSRVLKRLREEFTDLIEE
jgi:RNA polymerase sigma-70 factor (ECF subfamily)